MKKLIALLLAACLMLGLMTTAFAADEKSNDIVILYTNDVHCAVDDNIGYAGLAAYKKEMQAAYNYVALVDCGDSVQGDVIGTLSKGEYLVDIMNEVGYDFAAFGNHEFDYTLPQLQKLIDKAKYQYLCCNLTYTAKDGKGLTGGARLIRDLLKAVEDRGIPLLFNTKAMEFITDEHFRVSGVRTVTDDGWKNFYARDGVLIATGGFSGSREMLCRYMGGPLSRLVLRGSPYVTGENILLTAPLGAKFVHMDQFHCGPIVEETHANPNFVIDAGVGLDVDVRGKRFMDEIYTYTQKSMATATRTPENLAYHLIDSHWPKAAAAAKKFIEMKTKVLVADTPEELAKKMGLEPRVLTDLFAEFNRALKDGRLKEMNPPCSLDEPTPLDQGPFYAFPFQGGITATFGGPKINEKAEILTNEDRPIKGLYAAGNAAGGLFYGNYIGGTQLGGALVFGRIAARQMALSHRMG